MRSFEDEVEFVAEHSTKFSVTSEGAVFIGANSNNRVALMEESGNEKADKIQWGSFASCREDPRVGGASVDGSEDGSIVANGCLGVQREVELEKTEGVRIGGISEAARETLEVAFVAIVTLDGGSFGDVRKVFDGAFLVHLDDGIDEDVAKTDVDVSKVVMGGHYFLLKN